MFILAAVRTRNLTWMELVQDCALELTVLDLRVLNGGGYDVIRQCGET
jgi:hypothetical protein